MLVEVRWPNERRVEVVVAANFVIIADACRFDLGLVFVAISTSVRISILPRPSRVFVGRSYAPTAFRLALQLLTPLELRLGFIIGEFELIFADFLVVDVRSIRAFNCLYCLCEHKC